MMNSFHEKHEDIMKSVFWKHEESMNILYENMHGLQNGKCAKWASRVLFTQKIQIWVFMSSSRRECDQMRRSVPAKAYVRDQRVGDLGLM